MTIGGNVVRGERFKLAFAPEATYGTDPGTANYTNVFGVVQSANLPDPVLDILPVYALGTNSNRNFYIAYRNKMVLQGSIPDIWLLNGTPLYLAIGNVSTVGSSPYTHTIYETTALNSIALHVQHLDSTGQSVLQRRYVGGKVNRMTIAASEGDFLKCSIDEIGFLNWYHDQSGINGYNAGVADISPSYPTTEPYLFSYGSFTLNDQVFARVRSFRLDINNNLEPRYYVTDNSGSRLPYEYREGKREYRMSCTIDISDATLYKELARQGTYNSVYRGFTAKMVFTRGSNDTITIHMPAGAISSGGDAMGCLIHTAPHNIIDAPVVSVDLGIIVRSIQIVVVDAISVYPGNTARRVAEFSVILGSNSAVASVQT